MQRHSPTLEGFKASFRRPSVAVAEIVWRGCLGFAGIVLLTLGLIEYLDTLPVSDQDAFLLRTYQPSLVGRAIEHILRGSSLRLIEAGLLLALAYAIAWVVMASFGRGATLKALLGYFAPTQVEDVSWGIRSLFGLNGLRAAATLAWVIGIFAAFLCGGIVSPNKDPSPGAAALVFLCVVMLASLAWVVVNWLLSLASLFVVGEGRRTFGAIVSAAGLCRTRLGAVAAVGFWFGSAHLVAFWLAAVVCSVPLAFLSVLPVSLVFGAIVLVVLLYFAVADWLYIARLAAYLYIAKSPEALAIPEPVKPPARPVERPPSAPASPLATGIDLNELILSDLPAISS